MGLKEIGACLAVKNNVEAVELYKKVFELELGFSVKFPDSLYQHAVLLKNGRRATSWLAAMELMLCISN